MYFEIKAKAKQKLEAQSFQEDHSLIPTEIILPQKITFSCARSVISNCQRGLWHRKNPLYHRWSQNHMSINPNLVICVCLVDSHLYQKKCKGDIITVRPLILQVMNSIWVFGYLYIGQYLLRGLECLWSLNPIVCPSVYICNWWSDMSSVFSSLLETGFKLKQKTLS